jgi:hypothetical protein
MENTICHTANLTPTQTIISQLANVATFTGREVARMADVTEQRLAKWIAAGAVRAGTPTDNTRRLHSLRDALRVAITGRIADRVPDMPLRAAGTLGGIGAGEIVSEWQQAAYLHDIRHAPPLDLLEKHFVENGVAYFVTPDPFGVIDDAEERLKCPHVVCIVLGSYDVALCFSLDESVGDVWGSMPSPFIGVDLHPFCRGLLKPIAEQLRPRVIVAQPGIPDEIWQEWEQRGHIPRELQTYVKSR